IRSVAEGSLPALRTGTKPAPRRAAIGAPRMKPRASIATTWSTRASTNGSAMASIVRRNAGPLPRSGVMSLNTIPGVGKSGMSRISPRRSVARSRTLLMRGSLMHHGERVRQLGRGHGLGVSRGTDRLDGRHVGVRRPASDDIEESRGCLVVARDEQLDAAIGLVLDPPRQTERPRPFAHELPKPDALHTPDDAHVMDGHVRNLATDAEQCP